jgi:undecaprenyl-diphosphatase
MIDIIKFLVLGIIQGITEVFPVSSSGHLAIFVLLSNELHIGSPIDIDNIEIFLMITNFGSLIAMIIFFWNDLISLLKSAISFIFKHKESKENTVIMDDMRYILKLLIAVIPLGIAGLIFADYLDKFSSLLFVGISLLITGIMLYTVYHLRNKNYTNEITYKRSFIISIFQMFAIFPGISRSGITMIGGLSQKIELKKVLKFSFLAYIAISIPVSVKGILDALDVSESINVIGYFMAFLTSFIFTFLTVKVLYKYVKVNNLVYFAIYCILFGLLSIILYQVF